MMDTQQARAERLKAKARYYANCLAGETQGSRIEATLHAAFVDVCEADQGLIRQLTEALSNALAVMRDDPNAGRRDIDMAVAAIKAAKEGRE